MKTLKISIIVIFSLLFAQAESFIHGRIVDAFNQLPLAQANIIVSGTENGTTSDEQGEFVLQLSEPGYYSLYISYIGYESKILNDIWVRPNAYDYQMVVLHPSAILMDDIEVTDSYFDDNSLSNYSVIGFKNDQIRRAPGAGGEITRILNSLPSVASVGENRQDIMVRGGGPNENGFLIDNIHIPNISHFNQPDGRSNGPVGLINTELVENIEFYSNGFAPQFGSRLSSFGDIVYREGNKISNEGNIGLGLGGAGGIVEGPIGDKISYLASFRMSYLNVISDALNAGGLPSYNDYQGKIAFKPNQFNNFTFLAISGNSLYKRSIGDATSDGEDNYGSVKNKQTTFGINHRFIWSKNAYSNSSLSLTNQELDNAFYNIISDSVLQILDDNYKTIHLRNVNQIKIFEELYMINGMEINYRDLSYDFILNNFSFNDDLALLNNSAFFNLVIKKKNLGNISIGIRAEKSNFEDQFLYSPRFNLALNLPFRLGKIILNGGRYFQSPPEKYIGIATHNSLKSVRADQVSLSYEMLLNASTKLSLAIYNKQYFDAPIVYSADSTASPVFLMDRNITFNHLKSGGRAESQGLELLVEKKRAENFYGHFGGSIFNSTFTDYLGNERNRDTNYQYLLNVVGGYRPSNKWEISVRWSFFGGKPYTEIDEINSILLNESIYFTHKYNEKRTPAYHNLFLRYEYRKVHKNWNLISYVEFWNAYNRRNIETYSWSNSAQKIIETTYFSFIPVGGFEIEF